jgi:MYXO-CTERM domain-containing protein
VSASSAIVLTVTIGPLAIAAAFAIWARRRR